MAKGQEKETAHVESTDGNAAVPANLKREPVKYSLTPSAIAKHIKESQEVKEGETAPDVSYLQSAPEDGVVFKGSYDFGTIENEAGGIDHEATLDYMVERFGADVVVANAQFGIGHKVGATWRNWAIAGGSDEANPHIPSEEESQAFVDGFIPSTASRRVKKTEIDKLREARAKMTPEEKERQRAELEALLAEG